MSKKEYQVSPFGMHNFIKLLCFQLSISLLPSFFLPVILKSRAANLPWFLQRQNIQDFLLLYGVGEANCESCSFSIFNQALISSPMPCFRASNSRALLEFWGINWPFLPSFYSQPPENPRDGGAWWATVYGVAQSRTQLKWLSSSSSSFLHHTKSVATGLSDFHSPKVCWCVPSPVHHHCTRASRGAD